MLGVRCVRMGEDAGRWMSNIRGRVRMYGVWTWDWMALTINNRRTRGKLGQRWVLPEYLQFSSEHINLSRHILMTLLQLLHKVDSLAQNFPLARLHTSIGR